MPVDNPIANLYPSPPQPQQNALTGDPIRMLSMLSMLNQNARFQQEFNAQRAMGAAALSNLDPNTGLMNVPGFAGAVRNNPAAAWAGESAANLATAQAQAQYTLRNQQINGLYNVVGSLSAKPGATLTDGINAITDYSTSNGIPSSVYNGVIRDLQANKNNLHAKYQDYANRAQGAGAAEYMPIQTAGGQTIASQRGTPGYVAGAPTGLPVQGSPGADSIAMANKDRDNSAGIQQAYRPLEQMLPLMKALSPGEYGPTSDEYARLRALAITYHNVTGVNPDDSPQSVREKLNKYMSQWALGAQQRGETDYHLATAIQGNPHLDLTRAANIDLARTQLGWARMDAAAWPIYQQTHLEDQTGQGYAAWKSTYLRNYDPKAFEFDQMSPQEQQKTLKELGVINGSRAGNNAAAEKFDRTLALARQLRFVDFSNQTGPQAPTQVQQPLPPVTISGAIPTGLPGAAR